MLLQVLVPMTVMVAVVIQCFKNPGQFSKQIHSHGLKWQLFIDVVSLTNCWTVSLSLASNYRTGETCDFGRETPWEGLDFFSFSIPTPNSLAPQYIEEWNRKVDPTH